MECIICQDSGSEPLKNNNSCACKFKYHYSCWIDYVHSTTVAKCPTCRSQLTKKSTPYMPNPSAPRNINDVQISYQEFPNILERTTDSYQHTIYINSNSTPQNNSLRLTKGVKLLLCSFILTAIVIIYIVIIY